ncbi:MAG: hypothetical protein DKM50_13410 [Candidatus Margulisiibacteriota bacterium]|nr:MAG: hypothetical protein DKM50_13410 [Candidatus Margulisiibacteriota bacterium]
MIKKTNKKRVILIPKVKSSFRIDTAKKIIRAILKGERKKISNQNNIGVKNESHYFNAHRLKIVKCLRTT